MIKGWSWAGKVCQQCRRPEFDPQAAKIPWGREWLPAPVFWPGEFHGLYSPWVAKSWTPLSNFQKQITRDLQGAPLSLSCILNHLSLVWPKNKWDVGSWKISIFCTGKSGFEALISSSGKNPCCAVGHPVKISRGLCLSSSVKLC